MIAIISDIHGNYTALMEVLDKIDSMNISDVYCLGDVVGYYSQVNECCDELRKRNIPCVMGNHDWYMASGIKCERSRSVNDCLKYQKKIISKDNIEWIRRFPTIIYAEGVSMVHGGWNNPIDEYFVSTDSYFSEMDGLFFASGHSHKQNILRYEKNKVYCNPGSVGQPRDGDNRAAFATFDGCIFNLHRVKYDIKKTCDLMDAAGFSPYYYGCLWDASEHLHSC